jgi:U3 small nucleolar RNA-associated protein 11
MSALRNAVKRKTHKERSQPGERRKFGLLEKKKDYVLRARDFHKKEDAIKVLKTKAAYKNPDEFYFGMQRSRTRDGVHVGRADESNKYTAEELDEDAGRQVRRPEGERRGEKGGEAAREPPLNR